ncbi:helix-turn-helix domain-containing protein [Nocardioides sp. NPDC000445]|uniref:helix-turn-helix domain-containing protein n=1 Tax=Nocardioides sp. NPDC000445 TaxID=3154257 RepID=UPI00331D2691
MLLPLLRSRLQGELLAWVLLHPDNPSSLSEIAEAVGTTVPTVKREVDRLQEAGLVTSSVRGRNRVVTPTMDHPLYRPLAEVMALTFGPVGLLREALTPVDGIDEAFIHGSWAARYRQRPGAVPDDIDMIVIGTPDRDELYAAIEAVERTLRREVNYRVVSPQVWDADDGSFKTTVSSRPQVHLIGGSDD